MRALIVGAGAVGSVFAYYLKRGGADVAVYVRSSRRERVFNGVLLRHLRKFRTPTLHAMSPDEVFTEDSIAGARAFDQLWFCLPTAVLGGTCLDTILATSRDSTVVVVAPGLAGYDDMARRAHPSRLVVGGVGFLSQPSEVGEDRAYDYALPAGARTVFSGEGRRVRTAVRLLRRAGLPVAVRKDARWFVGATGAVLQPLVVALEASGWSFGKLRRGTDLGLAVTAAREALTITAGALGRAPPWYAFLLGPRSLSLLLRLATVLLPLDLEAYLRGHFTKVRPQTCLLMREYGELADAQGTSHRALDALMARLPGVAGAGT